MYVLTTTSRSNRCFYKQTETDVSLLPRCNSTKGPNQPRAFTFRTTPDPQPLSGHLRRGKEQETFDCSNVRRYNILENRGMWNNRLIVHEMELLSGANVDERSME